MPPESQTHQNTASKTRRFAITKIASAALLAATIIAAPALATQNNGTDETVSASSYVDKGKVVDQGWCSGPRMHTDYRCFKAQ
jgi:hypothetical protein